MRSQVRILVRPLLAVSRKLCRPHPENGDVAQLGERRPCTAEVVGSIPIVSTQTGQRLLTGFFLRHIFFGQRRANSRLGRRSCHVHLPGFGLHSPQFAGILGFSPPAATFFVLLLSRNLCWWVLDSFTGNIRTRTQPFLFERTKTMTQLNSNSRTKLHQLGLQVVLLLTLFALIFTTSKANGEEEARRKSANQMTMRASILISNTGRRRRRLSNAVARESLLNRQNSIWRRSIPGANDEQIRCLERNQKLEGSFH